MTDPIGRTDEAFNSVTHGIGAAAGAVALAVLVVLASRGGDVWEIASVSPFGAVALQLWRLVNHETRR